jgi:hypothetical protein
MKPLVAVVTCHDPRFAKLQQACRETWAKTWKDLVDIRFFIGNPVGTEMDRTVCLDCPDDYWGLPLKTWTMVNWARSMGYTHVFKCDDDTYVHIPRLLASGWEKCDYTGRQAFGHTFVFGQGGSGYWLSSRCIDIVANCPQDYWAQDRRKCLHCGCEDMAVGLLLKNNGIGLKTDMRYHHRGWSGPRIAGRMIQGVVVSPANNLITTHKVQPPQQHEIHSLFANE